ncbi:MAG: hypothetical protein ABJC55_18180, partial [Algoriphagus sp.]
FIPQSKFFAERPIAFNISDPMHIWLLFAKPMFAKRSKNAKTMENDFFTVTIIGFSHENENKSS